MLNIINLYAVSTAGIFAILLIRWASHFAVPYVPHVRSWTLSHTIYPLLIRRQKWTSITYIEAALLGAYIIANGVCIGLEVHGTYDLMLRSGMMASVNLIPLFLGGRTNLLANSFGIPLHAYYLVHHWVGRMVVTQGLLHAGLAISSENFTFDASMILAASALLLILLTSFYFVRGFMFEIFLQTHLLLAFTAIGGLIWHMFPGKFNKFLFPIISITLWSITTVCRLFRIYNNPGASILSYSSFPQPGLIDQRLRTVKLSVRVERHISAERGQHVYLYFSGLRWRYRFQAHPFMVAWCEHREEIKYGKKISFTCLTFLIQPQSGFTARLTRELQLSNISSKSFWNTISYDGPYGQDLHLERYETVMLAAKGIGIAGLLAYAQYLAQRNRHDDEIKKLLKLASTPNKSHLRNSLYRDAIRKVDLFWELDYNRQEKWISNHLRTLQDLDPGRRSNLIYCYYPEEKSSEPLIKLDEGWKCIYPGDAQLTLDAVIEQEAGKSRRNIVVTCGDAIFTQRIRKKVLEVMSKENIIEFKEVEFRPQGLGTQDDAEPGRLLRERPNILVASTHEDDEEVELVELATRGTRKVLSKAPRMQAGRVDEDNGQVENATRLRAFV